MDAAAMAIGAVPLGIYPTSSPEECRYVLERSGARLLLVQDKEQWEKVARVRHLAPSLQAVVTMPDSQPIGADGVSSWDEFNAGAEGVEDHRVEERLNGLDPGDVATMIYTSGTTGPPKAVMLNHDNLMWTALASVKHLGVTRADSVLSYLPLRHIAEQLFTVHDQPSRVSTCTT